MRISYKLYGGPSSGGLIELVENTYRTDDGYVRIRDYLHIGKAKYMTEYFVYESDLSNSRLLAETEFRNYFNSVFIKV
ncbi:TPA: hypothetical protein JI092_11910 [Acinetobacter baumannii]|nr:hypothetical protein [Acinetobacter baumannii]